ncbi:MAG: cytochrome c oxidase subunit 3 [Planctomycetota bacterium]
MATAEATQPEVGHDDHGHGDHPEWLAHHFETPDQQFEAGKLGIWLFLAQEVLFFTGLFVAYAVYRMNHPEVFAGAAEYLNTTLGAINTVVLLASSLAIAWAVRAVQLGDQKKLLWLHIFTLACAGVFMGIKVVEYAYKFDEGLYWAGAYAPTALVEGAGLNAQLPWVFVITLLIGGLISLGGYLMHELGSGMGALLASAGWGITALICGAGIASGTGAENPVLYGLTTVFFGALFYGCGSLFTSWFRGDRKAWGAVAIGLGLCIVGTAGGIVVGRAIQAGAVHGHHGDHAGHGDDSHAGESHGEDSAHAKDAAHADGDHAEEHGDDHAEETTPGEEMAATDAMATEAAAEKLVNQGNFFSIYFAMTGVHALHIAAGIAVIAWIIGRIARGDFSPDFYGPVEFVGLYWHLVDLVWIYLFPLLYLIH